MEWYDETARKELDQFVKQGPDFTRLADRLADFDRWYVYRSGDGSFRILTRRSRDALVQSIVKHADARAKGLDAGAEAVWLVDLYVSASSGLPGGQLWVAGDGTFGFGWLPDRPWGKSLAIDALLRQVFAEP